MLLNRARQPGLLLKHCVRYLSNDGTQKPLQRKLMYEGKLAPKIRYLKGFSIGSSLTLVGSYSYILAQKGLSPAIATFGVFTLPFLLSPVIISWFFKRYIVKLSYDPTTDRYTAINYGYLFNKRTHEFSKQQVVRSNFTSMLNTFEVGKEPFFLNEEDLLDVESVELYRSLVGLDRIKE